MSDDKFDKPEPVMPSYTPTPGLHQWTLWKDGARIDCEFRLHGQYGVEVQLLRNGELQAGRLLPTMTEAESLADDKRQLFEDAGWRERDGAG